MFATGNDFRFERWRIAMELEAERECGPLSPLPSSVRPTFAAACKGEAYGQIVRRLHSRSNNGFNDGVDILDYLEGIYVDPHRRRNAKDRFQKLDMRESGSFISFFPTFVLVVNEADIPCADRVELFWQKVSVKFQNELCAMVDEPDVTFDQFFKRALRHAGIMNITEVRRNQ